VGRTTPLRPDAARQQPDHLTASGPEHPWTGVRLSVTWGSCEILDPILVVPGLVAGQRRHRHRPRRLAPPYAVCACAWTSPQRTCRRSAEALHPPPADRQLPAVQAAQRVVGTVFVKAPAHLSAPVPSVAAVVCRGAAGSSMDPPCLLRPLRRPRGAGDAVGGLRPSEPRVRSPAL
jgi:hypothetical protein